MRIGIIGGSDAGVSAALRASEVNPTAEISVFLADDFPNYSICGLPFFLSGETPDWHSLAHRTEFAGIDVRRICPVQHIDAGKERLTIQTAGGSAEPFDYTRLVIATGAVPLRPEFEGNELPGVYELRSMQSAFAVMRQLERTGAKSAIVIGAGYIGVEMADALTHRGLAVALVGRSKSVLPSVDSEFGALVEHRLRSHGVEVVTETEVARIESDPHGLRLTAKNGWRKTADLILVAVGVRAASDLARTAGVALGEQGAIRVNSRLETSVPGIHAAGDCVETWHRVLHHYAYLPLGTTSHKQGRVAGENAAGGDRQFAGSVGTQVVKVFELAIARTGLRQCRLTGDPITGRLLGAQIVGHWKSEVAKHIDIFATALFHEMTVDGLNDLGLSYTPPPSSPLDPVQMSV